MAPPKTLLTRTPRLSVAVIGGGWAGLAAAVTLVKAGHAVTVLEMAGQLGGRARSVEMDGLVLDNGQHILIGAYTATLDLMRRVDADPQALLHRMPLRFVDGQGQGLALPGGPAVPAFLRGVLAHPHWSGREKLALLRRCALWALQRFRCQPQDSVADLARGLPARLRDELIDPLCVAALNTPAEEASGTVFLRVLQDSLFAGPGSSDLLLPRVSLGALFPIPAARWLEAAGATVRRGHRVQQIQPTSDGWQVDDQRHDRVVLATPPLEAARLVRPLKPAWADRAEALRFEPIVTAYVRLPGIRLPAPMVALPGPAPHQAAQFAFDHAHLRDEPSASGLLAFVISGAQPWLDRGQAATEAAILQQAARLAGGDLPYGTRVLKLIAEKRATFRCTPALAGQRPPAEVSRGLQAAGDYIAGPYPATLEGAVRSGVAAAQRVTDAQRPPRRDGPTTAMR